MIDDEAAAPGPDGVDLSSEIDPDRPSVARVYDYILGGKQHFAIDREVSKAMFEVLPESRLLAESGRITLLRMVRWLIREAGITQIVDLGSGLPTEGNVHEIAHQIDPERPRRLRLQRPDGAGARSRAAGCRQQRRDDPVRRARCRADLRASGHRAP